jgi:hypothetical protein
VKHRLVIALTAALLGSGAVHGQNPISADAPFQVRYVANLSHGDSLVNISNTGAAGFNNMCVNVYAFSPDTGNLAACCSCQVAADTVLSLNVKTDILGGVLPATNSAVIKLTATTGTCSPGSETTLISGMAAWGTTVHPLPRFSVGGLPIPPSTPTAYTTTETPFTPATLSAAEYATLTSKCAAQSSHGLCNSCRTGAQ